MAIRFFYIYDLLCANFISLMLLLHLVIGIDRAIEQIVRRRLLNNIWKILTANACIVCNSNTAKTVKCNSSYFTSTASTMLIITIILGHWIRVVAVDIVWCIWILELSKINKNALGVISSKFAVFVSLFVFSSFFFVCVLTTFLLNMQEIAVKKCERKDKLCLRKI